LVSCSKRHEREVQAVAVGRFLENGTLGETPDCFSARAVFSVPLHPFGEPDVTAVQSVQVDSIYNICDDYINLTFVNYCETVLLNEHTKEIRYKFVGYPPIPLEYEAENTRTRYNTFHYGDNPILVLD
jgi:hypothetical protein